MMFGFVAVIIQGSINQGGFGNIWRDAVEGGRIDFNQFVLTLTEFKYEWSFKKHCFYAII